MPFVNVGLRRRLGALGNFLSKFYQWITGKSSDIIEDGGLWYFENKGAGGSAANLQIKNTQVAKFDGVGSYISLPLNCNNIGNGNTIKFGFKRNGSAGGTYHALYTRLNSSSEGVQIFILNSDNKIGIYTDSANTFDYVVNTTWHSYEIQLGINSATLFVDGVEIETKTGIVFYDVPVATTHNISKHLAANTNGLISFFESLDFTYYFQESQGTTIYDQSGNGNHGTVVGAILADFWSETSDYAYPALLAKGGSKYLVNETAGVTATFGSPDGSNLGVEKVVNGGFDTDTDWTKGTSWTISSGTANFDGVATQLLSQTNVGTPNEYHLIEFDVIENNTTIAFVTGGSTTIPYTAFSIGTHRRIVEWGGTGTLQIYATLGGTCKIDNISVKEITPIDLTQQDNVWRFTIKNSASTFIEIPFISNIPDIYTNNAQGYSIFFAANGRITVFVNNGDGTHNSIAYTDVGYRNVLETHIVEVTRRSSGVFTFKISGGSFGEYTLIDFSGGLGTNPITDTTYTTTKFFVVDNDAGDEVNNIKLNGERYDVNNFITQTGTYGVQKVIGVSATEDAKGNELEYGPDCIWNTGNTYCQPSGDLGLYQLSKTYSELDFQYGADENTPLAFDYYDLKGIDVTVDPIPEDDFRIDNEGDCIKNMASAPYEFEPLYDVNGEILYDINGEKLYPLKNFS